MRDNIIIIMYSKSTYHRGMSLQTSSRYFADWCLTSCLYYSKLLEALGILVVEELNPSEDHTTYYIVYPVRNGRQD